MSRETVGIEDKIESELKGTTLLVYWEMLKADKEHAGVREVQRTLGLSSPSVALYHLEKLRGLGLLTKDRWGKYAVMKRVKVGVLQFFTNIGRFSLPRFLFYAVFFTTALFTYIIQYGAATVDSIVVMLFGTFASIAFWYETIRIWKRRP